MAKMPSRLRVDHFPKNGRPEKASERPGKGLSKFSPNSTAGVGNSNPKFGIHDKGIGMAIGKPGAKVTKAAGAHVPEQGGRKTPSGQWNNSKEGQGFDKPSFGIGKSGATLAEGKKAGVPHSQMADTTAHHKGNAPHHGHVPMGHEHHQENHREPRTHEEFHKLGSMKGDKY